jgi:hypothetical protein
MNADDYEARLKGLEAESAARKLLADIHGRRMLEAEKKIAYYEAPLPVGEGGRYVNVNDHRFSDEGICVRCGEDAENWEGGCVESLVNDLVDTEAKLAEVLAANARLMEHIALQDADITRLMP